MPKRSYQSGKKIVVLIPDNLLEAFREKWKSEGYMNDSEIIRKLIRDYVSQ